jgi:hypothetical protein
LLRCFVQTAVPEHDVMGFADGGSIDNLAVMPLLRRGVRCMIVFMASATPPDDTWERFATGESTSLLLLLLLSMIRFYHML